MKKVYNVGILGTGWIAEKMAITLSGMSDARAYAVASRERSKADSFAFKHNIPVAFGSYDELADCPEVDLVYVASPHSHHYIHAKMCLEKRKPVLCEKAFTINAAQARELVALSQKNKVYLAEAIWTRYQPMRKIISDIISGGELGSVKMLSANLCYPNIERERMYKPELAGGALLDIGVYCLNFASMCFGDDFIKVSSTCQKHQTGVDIQESITLEYPDGKMAVLHSSLLVKSDRQGIVSGDKGFMIVENINNPQSVKVFDEDYCLKRVVECPPQITGYEYQVSASIRAIEAGQVEPEEMPHSETIKIMEWMDNLRRDWGVKYPGE